MSELLRTTKTGLLVLLCIPLLLVTFLPGCSMFEGCDIGVNYITVIVQTRACATVIQKKYQEYTNQAPFAGAVFRIEIIKAGGERVTETRTADASGCTDVVTATFQVYKEQPVEVNAWFLSGSKPSEWGGEEIDLVDMEIVNNFEYLNWQQLDAAADFGDTYYWNPDIYPQVSIEIY